LISVLESLRAKGPHRGWESLYRALKNEWENDHITTLQERLNQISSQLRVHVIANQQEHILFQLEALREQNQRLATTRDTEIADLREGFEKFAEKLQMEIDLGTPPDTTWLTLSTVVTKGKAIHS
jgi:hypothetical protein